MGRRPHLFPTGSNPSRGERSANVVGNKVKAAKVVSKGMAKSSAPKVDPIALVGKILDATPT